MGSKPVYSTKSLSFAGLLADQPGELVKVPKSALNLDDEYQRRAQERKVRRLVVRWSWHACGTLSVARRADGTLHIMDGGHRYLAAMRRMDIHELPCIIHDIDEKSEEAKSCLQLNTDRKAFGAYDKYRVQLVARDPVALKAKALLDEYGYIVKEHGYGIFSEDCPPVPMIRCIGSLLSCIRVNERVMEDVWPCIVDLHNNGPIHERVLMAVFTVECKLRKREPGDSLLRGIYLKRLLSLGGEKIVEATRQAMIYHGRGGQVVWARALVELINKGFRNARNKISWDQTRDEA